MNLAVAQFEPKDGDKAYNLSAIRKLTKKAKSKGADLISFHEMSITAYTFTKDLSLKHITNLAEEVPNGKSTQELIGVSKEFNMPILAGLVEKSDGKIYNTYICVTENGVVAKYRKIHPFISKYMSAKTGTGGHLSGNKVIGKIAEVRNLKEGTPAVSPPTFDDLHTSEDFKNFANKVREVTGGIPIGFKLSANHIEEDIQFALDASADYIILDGRGGGTGAAPLIFRNNISVPTIPALARARHYLDKVNRKDITLIITGGIRVPDDFIKAMALGADGIALSNSALQSIGCVAARMCNTNNCPAGIATQKPELRKLLNIDKSANQLYNFFSASTELMKVMARACGHNHLNKFNINDITTWKKDMAELTGIEFGGVK